MVLIISQDRGEGVVFEALELWVLCSGMFGLVA